MTFESGGQRLGYGEGEPRFFQGRSSPARWGSSSGSRRLGRPCRGLAGLGEAELDGPLPAFAQSSGVPAGPTAVPRPPPAPPRSQRCAASPRGRRPGGAPAGAPRTAAVWSVLNSGWKRLVTGRLNLPRPATHPSSSSSFRVFSSKLPRGRGWGSGGGPQTKQTNEACGAVFGARRRALCGSLSDQRGAGDATGFRAVGFDRHLPSASPGRGAGGPEADELREPGANSGSAARCRRGRVPGSQQIGETREPNGEVSSLFRVAPTRPAL